MAKKFGFFQIKSQNYDRVADEEESTFTDEKGLNTKPLGSNYRSLPWCITTFLFAGLAALFFVRNLQLTRHGSFETGYPSELGMNVFSNPPMVPSSTQLLRKCGKLLHPMPFKCRRSNSLAESSFMTMDPCIEMPQRLDQVTWEPLVHI